jgi:bacteriorhodopsin
MTIVKKTGYLSLLVQFVTGLIDIWGLTLNVNPRFGIFKQLLWIELIVQVVEFMFYVWMVKNLDKVKNITVYRYFDWFITTPSMLLTLMAYLDVQSSTDQSMNLIQFIKKYFGVILIVFILNWMMLGFGLLGELGILEQRQSVLLGFIPFVIYYGIIYKVFIENKNIPNQYKNVYFYFLIVWSIYGIAALMNYNIKNSMYNILDLFAKNFFGLFLVYILYQEQEKETKTGK